MRRSTDAWFVHCNVGPSSFKSFFFTHVTLISPHPKTDTDVIFSSPSPSDPTLKPSETHQLIENFCLGLRRLELFARAPSVRAGWVSALAEGEDTRLASAGISLLSSSSADGDAEEGEGGEEVVVVDEDGQERVEVRPRVSTGELGGQVRAKTWDKDAWEAEVLAMSGGGRPVVPSSAGTPFAPKWLSRGEADDDLQRLKRSGRKAPSVVVEVVAVEVSTTTTITVAVARRILAHP